MLDLVIDKTFADCAWEQDWEGNWWTRCGKGVCGGDGTPSEGGWRYCAYCGKPLAEVLYIEDEDTEDEEAEHV